MNIFVLSYCPRKAAEQLCDQHMRSKMIIESAQMLANCYSHEQLVEAPATAKGSVRKHSYFNHPSSIWVRKSLGNFEWLLTHAITMVEDRHRRWPKSLPHATFGFLDWCSENPPDLPPGNVRFTDDMIAIPDHASCRNCMDWDELTIIGKYRRYYLLDKPFATWTAPGIKPSWI